MPTKKWTVVLIRPDYMADHDVPADIFVAFVKDNDMNQAVASARFEAFTSDRREGLEPNHVLDYAALLVFEGFHNPYFGWNL